MNQPPKLKVITVTVAINPDVTAIYKDGLWTVTGSLPARHLRVLAGITDLIKNADQGV